MAGSLRCYRAVRKLTMRGTVVAGARRIPEPGTSTAERGEPWAVRGNLGPMRKALLDFTAPS
jgi:hypothetical protein